MFLSTVVNNTNIPRLFFISKCVVYCNIWNRKCSSLRSYTHSLTIYGAPNDNPITKNYTRLGSFDMEDRCWHRRSKVHLDQSLQYIYTLFIGSGSIIGGVI